MSEGFTPPPAQHDQLPNLRIAVVASAWMVLVVLSVLGIRWWQHKSMPSTRAATAARMGESEIADVNQRPFALDNEAPRLRAEQGTRLEHYGWVDRDAGVIHMPIEQAMEQVLAEEGRKP
ncbi:MAG TPA: hypothetical protein VNA24_14485 [Hyalangium sp.]|nr:hypothetical protein [Hyalangium sp.]